MGTIVTNLQQSGMVDNLNGMLVREVDPSIRATAPRLKRAEDTMSGPTYLRIVVAHSRIVVVLKVNLQI